MLYYNESSTSLLNHVIKGSLFIVTFNNLFVLSIKIKNVYIWLLFNKGLLENDVTESTVFVTDSDHWFFSVRLQLHLMQVCWVFQRFEHFFFYINTMGLCTSSKTYYATPWFSLYIRSFRYNIVNELPVHTTMAIRSVGLKKQRICV